MQLIIKPSIQSRLKFVNNRKQILDWYKKNQDEYSLEMSEDGNGTVSFSFDDGLKDDIEDSLYFNRFDYDFV